MLPHEADRMMKAELQTPHEATWTPILWALKLLERARTEGKIKVNNGSTQLLNCQWNSSDIDTCQMLIYQSSEPQTNIFS